MRMLYVIIFLSFYVSLSGAENAVSPKKLDETIEKVIQKREYQWRMPRTEEDKPKEDSFIFRVFETLRQWVSETLQVFRRWWWKIKEWWRKLFPEPAVGGQELSRFSGKERVRLYLLIAVVAIILVLFLYRTWKKRGKKIAVVQANAVFVSPDVEDENVLASELPESGWYTMAQDLLKKGELRLALRALYLACLAHLSEKEWIQIARYKSNYDYLRELSRKARDREPFLNAFSENISIFERVWYGCHQPTEEMIELFVSNHDRMKTFAQG